MIKDRKKIAFIYIFIICSLLLSTPQVMSFQVSNNKNMKSSFHIELIDGRFFLWAEPDSIKPPEQGYPAIFLFHGATQHAFSWILGLNAWSKNQKSFTQEALEQGYVVICLESKRPVSNGPRAWDIFSDTTSENKDISYILSIIDWCENSTTAIDTNNLFCAGFSSGAFMCSKIGSLLEKKFNALAVHSGGNAERFILTETGPTYDLTSSYNISNTHPPTLIIHGKKDNIVPLEWGLTYYNDLVESNIDTEQLLQNDQGYIWIPVFNKNILQWFETFKK